MRATPQRRKVEPSALINDYLALKIRWFNFFWVYFKRNIKPCDSSPCVQGHKVNFLERTSYFPHIFPPHFPLLCFILCFSASHSYLQSPLSQTHFFKCIYGCTMTYVPRAHVCIHGDTSSFWVAYSQPQWLSLAASAGFEKHKSLLWSLNIGLLLRLDLFICHPTMHWETGDRGVV